MAAHVVICFRSSELVAEAGEHLAAATSLVEQATARGGRLIAWGATVYAFAFEVDALQDVVELAVAIGHAGSGPLAELAIGVSEGQLEDASVPTAKLVLTWGAPLVRATAFARAARPGEVLLDPEIGAARKGDLLTIGSRVGIYGKLRLRGLLLDVRHPWRTSLAESSRGLVRPDLVERPDAPRLVTSPGKLTLLRAARGAGGSRMLTELEQSVEPARTLRISPHPFGEPLGALRRAMLRAVMLGQAPLHLGGQAGHSLDALLAGEGLDPDSASELLSSWLSRDAATDPHGVLLLDDAGEIDADTLEVAARALTSSGEPFRLAARLTTEEPVPTSLAEVPIAQELLLGPLENAEAVALALRCMGGELDERAALRWARRGGALPLGIIESIREAFEAGEIVWEEGRAVARLRTSGGGRARPPKHWVKERFAHHDAEGRRVLEALAALGGQAEVRDLAEVIRRRSDVQLALDPVLAVLEASGWVQKGKPDLVGLPSASHRDGVLAAMKEGDFREWHRAACEVMASRDRPLAIAAAAVHALLAGETAAARELAARAGAAARAVGLEVTAVAFEQLAEHGDASALSARNLFNAQLELARAVPSVWPDAVHSSFPPGGEEEPELSSSVIGDATIQVLLSTDAGTGDGGPSATLAVEGPPRAAVEALRSGDAAAVERVAIELGEEQRPALAERLHAMAKLARGETGDAIRRLRNAAEEALRTGSRDQCRTLLALSVALAAAGKQEDALLEAITALARAREIGDSKGEHASLLFLARLSATAGHHDVAEAWTMAAEG